MLSLNHRRVFLCIILTIICLGFLVSISYADWNDWLEEKYEEGKNWWEDTKEQAEDWWKETEEGAGKTWDEGKARTDDKWRKFEDEAKEAIGDIDSYLSQISAKVATNVEEAVSMAKEVSGSYRREAWSVIETEKRRQLCSEYNDPQKVGELEKKRGILTEGAILAAKLLPVYDEEKGVIRTYDGFARDMVNQTPALAGSDLANDPVRCAALMLLDSDYLMYAKTIQASNGRWISIREAQECGYRTEEAVAAGSHYESARVAFEGEDSQRVERYMKRLSAEVTQLNIQTDIPTVQFDPLWILPFGVITIAGATYMSLDVEKSPSTKAAGKTKRLPTV